MARLRFWLLMLAFWVVQALTIHVLAVFWLGWSATVHGPNGLPWGDLADANFGHGLVDDDMVVLSAVAAAGVALAQAIFLFPVRRPAPAAKRGKSVVLSLAVAALAIGLLTVAILLAGGSALELLGVWGEGDTFDGAVGWLLLAAGVVSWAVATPLLVVYCRRTPRESLLGGVAARLFAGTVIEAAAVIPLDVMVRRRTDCYCGTGTFMTLTICGAVGVFALGPAVFLPLLAKRRRAHWEGRCLSCGYDMRGTPRAVRCPECGAAWGGERSAPPENSGAAVDGERPA